MNEKARARRQNTTACDSGGINKLGKTPRTNCRLVDVGMQVQVMVWRAAPGAQVPDWKATLFQSIRCVLQDPRTATDLSGRETAQNRLSTWHQNVKRTKSGVAGDGPLSVVDLPVLQLVKLMFRLRGQFFSNKRLRPISNRKVVVPIPQIVVGLPVSQRLSISARNASRLFVLSVFLPHCSNVLEFVESTCRALRVFLPSYLPCLL